MPPPQNDPGLSPHLAPVALHFWALEIHPKYLENETRETCVSESVNLESEFHIPLVIPERSQSQVRATEMRLHGVRISDS